MTPPVAASPAYWSMDHLHRPCWHPHASSTAKHSSSSQADINLAASSAVVHTSLLQPPVMQSSLVVHSSSRSGASTRDYKNWLATQSIPTLRRQGMQAVERGETSLDELLRLT